jgi:UDP-N-acetylmuramate: L-alanyl-gamma-D-glutamyl-meso-diaminopimelate ligase
VLWYKSAAVNWDIESVAEGCGIPAAVCDDIEQLMASTMNLLDGADKSHIVIMSNGGFEGFHQRLVVALT